MENKHLVAAAVLSVFFLLFVGAVTAHEIQNEGGNTVRGYNIECKPLPPHNATSVKDLKPSDIKVVMTVGDSITAGFSIKNDLFEHRGMSWSVGADEGALTLRNIFQAVNPNVNIFGGSVGTHLPELPGFPYYQNDVLNAAQSNAESHHLEKQVLRLFKILEQAYNSKQIDRDHDWKVFTLLIGANNVCRACSDKQKKQEVADDYEKNIRDVLTMLQLNVPRLFVNLVFMFNVSQVYDIAVKDHDTRCLFEHEWVGPIECKCALTNNSLDRVYIDELIQEFNVRLEKLAKEFNDKKLSDFAVAIQPMFKKMRIPSTDYLSRLDCFHPNERAHAAMATALWSTMITPTDKKKDNWDITSPLECPTEDSKLYF